MNFVDPRGIALAADGSILAADANAFGGNGGVIRVNPVSGVQTVVANGSLPGDLFVDPTGITVAANGDILVADRNAFGGNGGVIRVNPITGAQSAVSNGGLFVDPSGIALAGNGDILIADPNAFGGNGGVIRVNPSSGIQTVVASGLQPGNLFVDPTGIALAANGDILVADPNAFGGNGGVIRVNPSSGAQSTVASGGVFLDPSGIAVVPVPPPVLAPPAAPVAGLTALLVTGEDAGGLPEVHVYDARTAALKLDFFAYNAAFTGGVRVAVADVDGDGFPDIITAPGSGMLPEIKVFDGRTAALIRDFYVQFTFNPVFTGGVYVAAGDLNGDGCADIVVGSDSGGAPEVKVYSGRDGTALYDFFAYSPAFTGGVRVAVGDVMAAGQPDIITGCGPGGPPVVRVFSLGALMRDYLAYASSFGGGIFVAAGHVSGSATADVIVTPGAGGAAEIKVFQGPNVQLLSDFFAYPPATSPTLVPVVGDGSGTALSGGWHIATVYATTNGRAVILIGPGPGQLPEARVIDAVSLALLDDFFAYNPAFTGGFFVGG
jgi:hypothetical protein